MCVWLKLIFQGFLSGGFLNGTQSEEKNTQKKDVEEQNSEDFFFNQDIDYDEGIKSPGWARLQRKKLKRIK